MLFNYIGTALEYPLKVLDGSGKVITGAASIEASIIQILGVKKGTLPHNPYFGSELNRLLHAPTDVVAISAGTTYIVEALKQWERRIQVVNIIGETGTILEGTGNTAKYKGVLNFTITYKILATNEVNSFVYPFYKELEY
jgi:phage baseplate assembly protein W